MRRVVGDRTLWQVVRRNNERGHHACCCNCTASRFNMSELLKTRLDQKARTSRGGNRFRKNEANSYSRETQSRKVSYAKTNSEIYCKCDLYAKKLTRVKNSAIAACCTSCIQTSDGESIQKTSAGARLLQFLNEKNPVLISSTQVPTTKIKIVFFQCGKSYRVRL